MSTIIPLQRLPLSALATGFLLCMEIPAWTAPPPPPEGFIWRAMGVETYDTTIDLTEAFELTLNVSIPAAGADPDSATAGLTLGIFSMLPSNTATVYYEPLESANTLDFAVTGHLTGEERGSYAYDWNLVFSYPRGEASQTIDGAPMEPEFNAPIGVSSGGPIDLGFLDPSDNLRIDAELRLDLADGRPRGGGASIDATIDGFTGTLRIRQSYTVFEAVNPEPSSTLLLMLGSTIFFRRRRKP